MLIIGVVWGAWVSNAIAQPAPAPGSAIVDYVASLRRAGFDIIYSDALLGADMRVQTEPQDRDALARLREVLAPYALTLAPGPRGAWLVVRARRSPVDQARKPPPRTPPTPRLETIVVSASRYELAHEAAPSTEAMYQGELENVPALSDDALRAARVLPGLTNNGLTARFHVRGGATDEDLFLLDGVHLYDPYHLKDFQSLFSSISPRVLDSVEVRTGGFPAEFGKRMSGVVDMRSSTPAEQRHYEVASDPFTTSVLSSGRFAEGRGRWLTSLRASNLDVVADTGDADIGEPRYDDFFNKLSFDFGSDLTLTAGALLLNDEVSLKDSDVATASDDDEDRYLWLSLLDDRGRLTARYLLTTTNLDDGRDGAIDDPSLSIGELHERRRFASRDLKADWSLRFSDRRMLRWGAELEAMSADYRFESSAAFPAPVDTGGLGRPPNTISARPALSGQQQAAYLSYRFRTTAGLTAEAGLRWDRQTYMDAAELSPRLNLRFDVGRRATLRAAWGRFYQAPDVGELQVGDGATELYPVQESEQTILGFEYLLGDAASLRLEAYRKQLERPQPRFENLYYRISLLPELLPDRVMIAPQSGEASGVELTVDGRRGPWSWWLALARSSVRDEFADGSSAPRSWDEPWSAKAGATWSGPRWTATLTATTHAGWPTTGLSLSDTGLVAGAYNAERLGAFATLNVKAARRVELAHGRLSWFVELDNALDRANPCCLEYTVGGGAAGRPATLSFERRNWLPLVPSVGFLWEY